MSEIKFCKDCKFQEKVIIIYNWNSGKEFPAFYCRHPQYTNLVTGEKLDVLCETAREVGSALYCGREAKYFEPKE